MKFFDRALHWTPVLKSGRKGRTTKIFLDISSIRPCNKFTTNITFSTLLKSLKFVRIHLFHLPKRLWWVEHLIPGQFPITAGTGTRILCQMFPLTPASTLKSYPQSNHDYEQNNSQPRCRIPSPQIPQNILGPNLDFSNPEIPLRRNSKYLAASLLCNLPSIDNLDHPLQSYLALFFLWQ